MKSFAEIPDADFIFGILPIVANKTDTLLERALYRHNITSRQWLLMLVLFNMFDSPPTLKELAKEMGSSHQNVKQMALKLEEKGMLTLEKDEADLRATRVSPTEKSFKFWRGLEEDALAFMRAYFDGIDDNSLKCARESLSKIMQNLTSMEAV